MTELEGASDLQALAGHMSLIFVVVLWLIAGNVFKRIYEMDRSIPPTYKD